MRLDLCFLQGIQKPFKEVIDVSSADPHKTGMKPISFVRQVLAVCLYPELLHNENLPRDVRLRAQTLLRACGGSVGLYSSTLFGLPHVHKSIAEFITRRDEGVPSSSQAIVISPGSHAIVVKLLFSGEGETPTGVLTPIPFPHTLPMVLDDAGVTLVPHHLREDKVWAVDLEELHRAVKTYPGNPTGHVQDRSSIEEVIRFAATEGLLLLVDEVYQDSVFQQGREFISYKKVLFEMGQEYSEIVELISIHSLSNGIIGECGLRGAYLEVINMDPAVMVFLKSLQIGSPAVLGQLAMEIMINPPKHEDPSYETYAQVRGQDDKITTLWTYLRFFFFFFFFFLSCCKCILNNIPVIIYGLYLKVNMMLTASQGVEADMLYCQWLLEEEGICVGAGSENGQVDKNYHLR
uniref:alanine transaminase n=1 Tax=Myripristis murdjan TaxID=586833 RepID=A0A667Z7M9_9TELE